MLSCSQRQIEPRPSNTIAKTAKFNVAAPGTQYAQSKCSNLILFRGVQDTLFDYLGEMLENNVLGFELDDDIEDVDF